jgi:hypothetical protein
VFSFWRNSATGDQKKIPVPLLKRVFFKKLFKKFVIFLRKKRKNSPDLDRESVELA